MSVSDQSAASKIIWDLWEAGAVADDLPPRFKPQTREDGYAIQAGFDALSNMTRVGWKIAATSIAGQRHIGVSGPIAGRIFSRRVLNDGSQTSIATNRMRVAEPEFAFRFGRDLGPRGSDYSVAEVMAAVEALHLAIELPDSRFADFAAVGGATLIADNACAHELVLGRAVAATWRDIELSRHRVQADISGRERREGIGSNVLGDPRAALTWLVNELCVLGIGVRAGEFVTTGTCMVPIALAEGDEIRADFGVLGGISVKIA